MSVAIITSPQASSQMTFAWDQPETYSAAAVGVSSTTSLPLTLLGTRTRSTDFGLPVPLPSEATGRNSPAESKSKGIAAEQSVGDDTIHFVNQRIGKPVRIGGVMFQLLKRYGITDEEISQGVLEYVNACN